MKLRIKWNSTRKVIDITEAADTAPTLQNVVDQICNSFCTSDGEFRVSLNGVDPIEDPIETRLCDLGIVSGDLLFVIGKSPPPISPSPVCTESKPDNVAKDAAAISRKSEDDAPSTSAGKMDVYGQEFKESDSTVSATPPEVDPEAIKDHEVNRYLTEPIQVCESTNTQLPKRLEVLLKNAAPSSGNDALVVVLHVLMLETGFMMENNENDATMPPNWKIPAGYNISYLHYSASSVTFTLSIIPVGPVLVVHGRLKNSLNPCQCQMQIKLSDYFKELDINNTAKSFKCLSVLSRLFKDLVSHKMLVAANDDYAGVPTLDTFVLEIQLQITKYLNVKDLLALAQTCRPLNELCNSSAIWRRLYMNDFGRRSDNNDLSQDWKRMYKDKYVMRKRQEQMREQMRHPRYMIPPEFSHPHPPLPFAPVYPSGLIGGDYDRDPHFPGPGFGPGPRPFLPQPRIDPFFGPAVPDNIFRPNTRGRGTFDPPGPGRRPRGTGGGGLGGFGPRFF